MIRRLIMALLLFMLIFSGVLHPVAAYDPFSGACSSGANSSAVCSNKTNTDPLTGSNGLIIKITNLIAYVAGIAAVILLIVGGLRYITSGGDSSNVASAKNTIVYALIGLVVIVLARTIVAFVVTKL